MTKPINAIELMPHADLTAHWLSNAIAQLYSYSKEIGWDEPSYSTLKIPSQLMAVALPFVAIHKFHIEVDFDYAHDEWSYNSYRYNVELGEFDEIVIWSSGA